MQSLRDKINEPVPKLLDTNIPDPATGTYLRAPFDGAYAITQLFGENPDFHSKFTYAGVPLKGNNSLDFATGGYADLQPLMMELCVGLVLNQEVWVTILVNMAALRILIRTDGQLWQLQRVRRASR